MRATHHHKRALGSTYPVERGARGRGQIGRRLHRTGRHVGHVHVGGQHILRQRDHHRPGPADERRAPGPGEVFGQPLHIVHLRHPLGQGREHRPVIHLLKGFAVAVAARDLPDEEDHRRRILPRHMDTAARVRGPRAAGDEGHAGLPRQLARGLRHHRSTALVAADDIGDPAVIKPVERGEEAFARHGKHPLHAVRGQKVAQYPAPMPHRSPPFRASSHIG